MAEVLPPSPGPAALSAIKPHIRILPAGTRLLRLWFATSPHPSSFNLFRSYGPTNSRFDHHFPGPNNTPADGDRAILYTVEEHPRAFITAIAEVFQQQRLIDLREGSPVMSIFATVRDLSLLDLTDHWTTRAGASAALSSGPRDIAREWSRDFYAAYPSVDGLRYRSSMSGGSDIALALYERSRDAMPVKSIATQHLDHPEIVGSVIEAAELLGYAIRV